MKEAIIYLLELVKILAQKNTLGKPRLDKYEKTLYYFSKLSRILTWKDVTGKF
jgi:hypothetical protein